MLPPVILVRSGLKRGRDNYGIMHSLPVPKVHGVATTPKRQPRNGGNFWTTVHTPTGSACLNQRQNESARQQPRAIVHARRACPLAMCAGSTMEKSKKQKKREIHSHLEQSLVPLSTLRYFGGQKRCLHIVLVGLGWVGLGWVGFLVVCFLPGIK